MNPTLRVRVVTMMVAAVCLLGPAVMAKVKVHVDSDKVFDFKAVRTWAWNPASPGQIIMARTPQDDPEGMKKLAEPPILESVSAEMGRLKLQTATSQPDLMVTYYLLLSVGEASQTMGQFLPSTTQWGLPPFAPSTSSLTVMNTGSLVLDLAAKGNVVWRGVAQAKITPDAADEKRTQLLREAVRELLKKYPPKQ